MSDGKELKPRRLGQGDYVCAGWECPNFAGDGDCIIKNIDGDCYPAEAGEPCGPTEYIAAQILSRR
jgi:hypothetical protein